jgi:hypothetical protein
MCKTIAGKGGDRGGRRVAGDEKSNDHFSAKGVGFKGGVFMGEMLCRWGGGSRVKQDNKIITGFTILRFYSTDLSQVRISSLFSAIISSTDKRKKDTNISILPM